MDVQVIAVIALLLSVPLIWLFAYVATRGVVAAIDHHRERQQEKRFPGRLY